ncbi:hypothetical protein DPMN_031601 [Dreissena polymorpha]|uniref:G-protein coupled receptors family 1 profile domain-containing protein n=1 Tax=Dreissena polymorpha TaxID=45954 RepID=A0A9D4RI68_DREPO|nr:hypothetical protein DPMN_031601 [Dreissena polymorpha]
MTENFNEHIFLPGVSVNNTFLHLLNNEENQTHVPKWFFHSWPGCPVPNPLPARGSFAIAAYFVWAFATPFLIAFGSIGNTMTALVILRGLRKIRSTDVMLLALAVSDTVFLYSSALFKWLDEVWDFNIRGINDATCKIGVFLTATSFTSSAWILVVLTVERLTCILRPHRSKMLWTVRSATTIVVFLSLTICLLYCHMFYGFTISAPRNFLPRKCGIADVNYFKFHVNYLKWVHFAVGYTVPAVVIVCGNIFIIRELRGARIEKRFPNVSVTWGAGDQTGAKFSRQLRNLTVMLVSLNVMFFATQTPMMLQGFAHSLLVRFANAHACDDFTRYLATVDRYRFAEAVVHIMAFVNSAVNFLLYVISGSRFRASVKALVTCQSGTDTSGIFLVSS